MKKILWTIFIILAVILIAALVYILYLFNIFNSGFSGSYEEIDRDRSELRVDDVDASNDSFTVLILGIDADAERTQDGQINADNFQIGRASCREGSWIARFTRYVYAHED